MTDTPMFDIPLSDAPRQGRFGELAALRPGWFEGDGAAVSPAAIDMAQHVLIALTPVLGDPGIFPMISGGVSLEWASPTEVRTVEIEPSLSMTCFELILTAGRSEHVSAVHESSDRTVHTVADVLDFFQRRTTPPTDMAVG